MRNYQNHPEVIELKRRGYRVGPDNWIVDGPLFDPDGVDVTVIWIKAPEWLGCLCVRVNMLDNPAELWHEIAKMEADGGRVGLCGSNE